MKKVLLLLANGFEAYEASVFTDVFGWAKSKAGLPVSLVCAARKKSINCTWNFIVQPEMLVTDVVVDEFDAIAIPGGMTNGGFYEDAYQDDFLRIIRQFHEKGKIIASICVGALVLGKSGILKNVKATTYSQNLKRKKILAESGAIIIDENIVIDKNVITSSSPATAIDVAFKLLEILTSEEECLKVKKLMGFLT